MHGESTAEERAGQARAEQPLRRLHLLYHELRPGRSEYLYAMETEAFAQHADLVAGMRGAEGSGLWPEVTFDDGHLSDVEYALPILQSRGLTARFFITVGWTGQKPGYMGWAELRSLQASGQVIGAHGWSHTLLTHCAKKDLDKELGGARLLLEDKLGTSVTTMSLPGGRYDRRVLAACREAGYSRVYTSEPRAESDLGFLVGRLNIRSDMTLEWVRQVLQPGSGTLASLERKYRMKAVAQRVLGDRLYGRLWAALNRKEAGADGGEDAA